MSFIPENELRSGHTQNLAPMIDFLFLMLMFFASLAISHVTTQEAEIDLVEIKPPSSEVFVDAGDERQVINITINARGEYKWVTEIRDYKMNSCQDISNELLNQYSQGFLPDDKNNTEVLLKIDKNAPWEPILKLIFAVKEAGFPVYPIYLPEEPVQKSANT